MESKKNKYTTLSILIALASLILLFTTCDQEVNPCDLNKPVSAEFDINQTLFDFDSVYSVDTVLLVPYKNIYLPQSVTFVAHEEEASYQWIIGDDPRYFNSKSVKITFKEPVGRTSITLIVNKDPNSICFPNDDGIDTVKKDLYILSKENFKYAFEGVYTGYNEDTPSDIFDLTITDLGNDLTGPAQYGFGIRIHNLPKGCGGENLSATIYSPHITSSLYKEFGFISSAVSSTCPEILGLHGKVFNNNKSIVIYYKVATSPGNVSNGYMAKKFLGIRKNY